MARIQELWGLINLHNYGEVMRVKNQIKENKLRINTLMRDNLFELDVNSHEQKQLLKVNKVDKKVRKELKHGKGMKKIKYL